MHIACVPSCTALGSAGQDSLGGLAPFLPGPFLSSEMLHYVFTTAQGVLETNFVQLAQT